MPKRTQLLVAIVLPFLSVLGVAACAEDPAPSDGDRGTGARANSATGGVDGDPSTGGGSLLGSGATSSGGTGLMGTGGHGGDEAGNGGTPGASGGVGGSAPVGGAGGDFTATDPDVLTVQLDQVRQIIRGFGINATIMAQRVLPWEQLFTLEGEYALGLSILRISMQETGEHRAVPSDWETARTLGARVIGTCWSAPATWKTNSSITAGGHLLPEYYEHWATRIAQYASEHGLYAMSIGNQTDFASCGQSAGTCAPPLTDEFESMVYTGKEMAEFVKVAGPIFDDLAPDTKMIAPEASLWLHVWSNLSPNGEGIEGAGYKSSDPLDCGCFANEIDDALAATCASHCQNGSAGELAEEGYDYGHWLASDPAAWSSFDILGVHQYETQVGYAWPEDVTAGVRDREVWQTEMASEMHWPEQGPSTDIRNGVAVARWIHSALTVGEASAWLYWQYKAQFRDINDGLALLVSNSSSDAPVAKRYFTMGNFSRYIRPDVFHAVRVAGPSPEDVMVSGYLGDGGEVVIVAINETSANVELPIAISGGMVPTTMVPYVTSATENWAEGAPVALAEGSLPAALPALSVTTFVSQ